MKTPREVAHVLDICNVRLAFGLHSSVCDTLTAAIAARDAEVREATIEECARAAVAGAAGWPVLADAAARIRSLTSGTPR